jgi:hypothetical protein
LVKTPRSQGQPTASETFWRVNIIVLAIVGCARDGIDAAGLALFDPIDPAILDCKRKARDAAPPMPACESMGGTDVHA